MSKYGLQLRGPQKKQPTKPSIFGVDDDDDVEKEISRHALKNKSLKDIEEQHKKALEEDPSVFDYDGVYDEVKQKASRPVAVDRQERKPRYIQGLIDKAKQREREHEIIYEKKIAKERGKDDHLYADKDKFVTAAYKRKLAENQKWMEEERIRELKEARDDVTKKKDITDFYFNLSKNVAFGAEDAHQKKADLKQQKDASVGSSTSEERHPSSEPNLERTKSEERPQREASSMPEERSRSNAKAVSEAAAAVTEQPKGDDHKKSSDEPPQQPSAAEPNKENHQKRSLDAVAAAKERFLARKKAKDQKLFEAAANAPL